MSFDDNKFRQYSWKSKQQSTPLLHARIARPTQCSVVSCQHPTIYASSYCHRHRLHQKWSGSPFATLTDLRVISERLKGPTRASLTSDPSDLMAFERACRGIQRYSDGRYRTTRETVIKYRRHWTNSHKAPLALWMSLQKLTPEELLETSLGAAMHLYMHRDDLAVTERHLTNLIAKSMASVVVPSVFSQGERTRAGRLLVDILDDCYGARHWRGCLRDSVFAMKIGANAISNSNSPI